MPLNLDEYWHRCIAPILPAGLKGHLDVI